MATNFCPSCGAELKFPEAEICPTCGVRIKEPPVQNEQKSPGIATVLAIFLCGSGQVYNGELGKGLALLIGTIIGTMCFIIPGLIVWIYSIYDAYTTANKMNLEEIPFKKASTSDIIIYIAVYIVAIFVSIITLSVIKLMGVLG